VVGKLFGVVKLLGVELSFENIYIAEKGNIFPV
jgi:hypothetical protein